jgi:hypothetical protein
LRALLTGALLDPVEVKAAADEMRRVRAATNFMVELDVISNFLRGRNCEILLKAIGMDFLL